MTLVEFLTARIAEDRTVALGLQQAGDWDALLDEGFGARSHDDLLSAAVHRFDAARILAECEAKRKIISRYEDTLARSDDPEYSTVVAQEQAREYEDFVLPSLALPYADHPDYDESWRP